MLESGAAVDAGESADDGGQLSAMLQLDQAAQLAGLQKSSVICGANLSMPALVRLRHHSAGHGQSVAPDSKRRLTRSTSEHVVVRFLLAPALCF
jgi:hypothetical protein